MNFKKVFALSFLITLSGLAVFQAAESSDAYAAQATDSVVVTLEVTTGITITSPADTYMSTNLGVSTNVAVATTTWNVKTNNAIGYSLTLAASTNPAMKSAGPGTPSIKDYSTTTNPSLWSVTNDARFGFSVQGTDVSTATWGTPTGNFCNGAATSTVNAGLKYYGFYTTATSVATRSSTTTTSGVDTTVCYAVEQNGVYASSGTYTATITATATTL